jgi:hypothetical protein
MEEPAAGVREGARGKAWRNRHCRSGYDLKFRGGVCTSRSTAGSFIKPLRLGSQRLERWSLRSRRQVGRWGAKISRALILWLGTRRGSCSYEGGCIKASLRAEIVLRETVPCHRLDIDAIIHTCDVEAKQHVLVQQSESCVSPARSFPINMGNPRCWLTRVSVLP